MVDTNGLSEGEFNHLLSEVLADVARLANECEQRAADAAMRETLAEQDEQARITARASKMRDKLFASPEMAAAIKRSRGGG